MPARSQQFWPAAQIAFCLETNKKAIQRRAMREGWPRERYRNSIVLSPSAEIAEKVSQQFAPVDFQHHATLDVELRRAVAVFQVRGLLKVDPSISLETAAHLVCVQNRGLELSTISLVRWYKRARRDGIKALADRRAGHSGRKAER